MVFIVYILVQIKPFNIKEVNCPRKSRPSYGRKSGVVVCIVVLIENTDMCPVLRKRIEKGVGLTTFRRSKLAWYKKHHNTYFRQLLIKQNPFA